MLFLARNRILSFQYLFVCLSVYRVLLLSALMISIRLLCSLSLPPPHHSTFFVYFVIVKLMAFLCYSNKFFMIYRIRITRPNKKILGLMKYRYSRLPYENPSNRYQKTFATKQLGGMRYLSLDMHIQTEQQKLRWRSRKICRLATILYGISNQSVYLISTIRYTLLSEVYSGYRIRCANNTEMLQPKFFAYDGQDVPSCMDAKKLTLNKIYFWKYSNGEMLT